jgi:hypothetical protein
LIVRTHWHVLSNTHGRRRVETQSVSSKPVRAANRAPGCGAADRRSLRIFRRVGRHQLATAGRPTMGSSLNGVIPRWTPERRPYDYRRSCVQGGRRERSAGVGKGDSDPSIRAANDPGEGGSFGEFDSLRSAKFLQSRTKTASCGSGSFRFDCAMAPDFVVVLAHGTERRRFAATTFIHH